MKEDCITCLEDVRSGEQAEKQEAVIERQKVLGALKD